MKPELEFYDVKSRSKFKSTDWRVEIKTTDGKTRYFAVSKVPGAAHEAWRIVSEAFAKANA
jgi:hypothetical protein